MCVVSEVIGVCTCSRVHWVQWGRIVHGLVVRGVGERARPYPWSSHLCIVIMRHDVVGGLLVGNQVARQEAVDGERVAAGKMHVTALHGGPEVCRGRRHQEPVVGQAGVQRRHVPVLVDAV